MEFVFDADAWEPEADRSSFEDSDRFEEDSMCSWISDTESLCTNWRGWKKPSAGAVQPPTQAFPVNCRTLSGKLYIFVYPK